MATPKEKLQEDIVLEFMKKVFNNIKLLEDIITEFEVKDIVLLGYRNHHVVEMSINDYDGRLEWACCRNIMGYIDTSLSKEFDKVCQKRRRITNRYQEIRDKISLEYKPSFGSQELQEMYQGYIKFFNHLKSEGELDDMDKFFVEDAEDSPVYEYFKNYMSKEKFMKLIEYNVELEVDEVKYYKKYIEEYKPNTDYIARSFINARFTI